MSFHDWIGLQAINTPLPWRRAMLISFIRYAFSSAIGMLLLVPGSNRCRLYTPQYPPIATRARPRANAVGVATSPSASAR